jgi:hypothetical protein
MSNDKSNRFEAGRSAGRSGARRARGFTIIEMAVGGAAAAVLAVLAVPALDKAEHEKWQAGCIQMQGVLGAGQAMYMADNRDQYAGVNTSGRYYQGVGCFGETPSARWMRLVGTTTSRTPTTTWDWISPTVGDAFGLPSKRAERTKEILSKVACPAAKGVNAALFGNAPDLNDFMVEQSRGAFRQVSYLQPGGFHLYSIRNTSVPRECGAQLARDVFGSPVATPAGFFPRLDKVGTRLSDKVMHACGTRYISAGGVLDIDITPSAATYSWFADAGPILHTSTAYGRSTQSPNGGVGWRYSFRHFDADLVVTFFDGSVKPMYAKEAYSQPKYWYPTGSVFTRNGATPEAQRRFANGAVLD